jgi:hypothetical protein
MTTSEETAIVKGVMHLLEEIVSCQDAGATVAAAAMVYVCIDTMAFLSLPAGQTTQEKKDFIKWVDTYLNADPIQKYQYRGIDVYAARCSLLHAFSAETEAHRKDPSIVMFGYADNGPHAFDAAESTRLAVISVAVLIHDLCKAVHSFVGAWRTDPDLRARVAGRLNELYNVFPIKDYTAIRSLTPSKVDPSCIMTNRPLFDPATVPPGVVSPAGVAHVNSLVQQLREKRIDQLEIQEPDTRFRVSNMIRAYNQVYLRRCLQLIEAAHHLVYSGQGIVALMAVRGIYETIAAFLDFKSQLQGLLHEGDLQKIHDFVAAKTFTTRLQNLIDVADTTDVTATSVLTQIDKMNRVYPEARSDYDYLCEHTHPNVLGGFLYFAVHEKPSDIVVFTDKGPAPEDDLHWVLVGGNLVGHFIEALNRIEQALPALSESGRQQRPILRYYSEQ